MFEVTPIHCVVEISKSAGDLTAYKEVIHVSLSLLDLYPARVTLIYPDFHKQFCESLSSLLRQSSAGSSSELQASEADEKARKELIVSLKIIFLMSKPNILLY